MKRDWEQKGLQIKDSQGLQSWAGEVERLKLRCAKINQK